MRIKKGSYNIIIYVIKLLRSIKFLTHIFNVIFNSFLSRLDKVNVKVISKENI